MVKSNMQAKDFFFNVNNLLQTDDFPAANLFPFFVNIFDTPKVSPANRFHSRKQLFMCRAVF